LSSLLGKSSHGHILLSSFLCQSFQGMSVTEVEKTRELNNLRQYHVENT
jgi:hypothetical protein